LYVFQVINDSNKNWNEAVEEEGEQTGKSLAWVKTENGRLDIQVVTMSC
jgi:hypothetical protein